MTLPGLAGSVHCTVSDRGTPSVDTETCNGSDGTIFKQKTTFWWPFIVVYHKAQLTRSGGEWH